MKNCASLETILFGSKPSEFINFIYVITQLKPDRRVLAVSKSYDKLAAIQSELDEMNDYSSSKQTHTSTITRCILID